MKMLCKHICNPETLRRQHNTHTHTHIQLQSFCIILHAECQCSRYNYLIVDGQRCRQKRHTKHTNYHGASPKDYGWIPERQRFRVDKLTCHRSADGCCWWSTVVCGLCVCICVFRLEYNPIFQLLSSCVRRTRALTTTRHRDTSRYTRTKTLCVSLQIASDNLPHVRWAHYWLLWQRPACVYIKCTESTHTQKIAMNSSRWNEIICPQRHTNTIMSFIDNACVCTKYKR